VSCRFPLLFPAILSLIAVTGCARRAEQPAARIAVLRFENLGNNPADDWMGRVLSEAVSESLARDRALSSEMIRRFDAALGGSVTAAPGISAERSEAVMAGAGLIGYGRYTVRGGQVTAVLTVQRVAGNRTEREMTVTAPASELLGIAERLARGWSERAQPYITRTLEAARAYAGALEAPTLESAAPLLEKAAAADPAYAPPQMALARMRAARQDGAGAVATLSKALEAGDRMTPVWRARLEFELASLRGDVAGRNRALEALAKASPEDPLVWRASADAAFARNDMVSAAGLYRKALALDPNDLSLLNQAGYALAGAGDWKGANESLERYRKLRPNDPNPLDSLGDIHLETGRFQEAAGYYEEAQRKSPEFLGGASMYKAAMARLMTGDVAAADALAKRYIDARQAAGDPIIEYRKADWSWTSGRRREGYERLAAWAAGAANGGARPMAARAYAQLAIWSLTMGRREVAAQMAAKSAALAGAAPGGMATMAQFLTQPPASSSEWAVRAERSFPDAAQASFRNFARAYAVLFEKDFAAAVPLLRELYQSGAQDPSVPVLLAWAYLQTGKTAEAAPLLARIPIPSREGAAAFSVMQFPRLFYLRGMLAEKEGKADAARAAYRTFLQLSGTEPLQWGEEAAAAAKAK
jgi:tetratricopeptide (TPR) repeat protein